MPFKLLGVPLWDESVLDAGLMLEELLRLEVEERRRRPVGWRYRQIGLAQFIKEGHGTSLERL